MSILDDIRAGEAPSYTKADVARAAGITLRQLDHWMRNLWVQPLARATSNPKSRLIFDEEEVDVAEVMGALVRLGFGEDLASHLARERVDGGPEVWIKVGKGVTVCIGDVS